MQFCSFAVCCPRVAITVITARPTATEEVSRRGTEHQLTILKIKYLQIKVTSKKQVEWEGENEQRRGNRVRQKYKFCSCSQRWYS